MKTWTVDEMLAEVPCGDYPRERIVELWAGRERVSLSDVLTGLPILNKDRVWMACRPKALRLETLEGWVVGAVERAVRRAMATCTNVRWLDWAQGWMRGNRWGYDAAYAAQVASHIVVDQAYSACYAASKAAYVLVTSDAHRSLFAYRAFDGAATAAGDSAIGDRASFAARDGEFARQVADLLAKQGEWE